MLINKSLILLSITAHLAMIKKITIWSASQNPFKKVFGLETMTCQLFQDEFSFHEKLQIVCNNFSNETQSRLTDAQLCIWLINRKLIDKEELLV